MKMNLVAFWWSRTEKDDLDAETLFISIGEKTGKQELWKNHNYGDKGCWSWFWDLYAKNCESRIAADHNLALEEATVHLWSDHLRATLVPGMKRAKEKLVQKVQPDKLGQFTRILQKILEFSWISVVWIIHIIWFFKNNKIYAHLYHCWLCSLLNLLVQRFACLKLGNYDLKFYKFFMMVQDHYGPF